MYIEEVDEFTLTQPIVSVTERSVIQTVNVITQKKVIKQVNVITQVNVIKQVNVITQKKAKRNVHNKRSRCSNTLNWVEVETGVKYRKLGKNEKGGY